jgi:putrescine transport system ATP-binding protein
MAQQFFAARHGTAVVAPAAPVGASRPWLDPAAQPYVRIEGVTKRFGPATAVDDVSISIYRGEFFALLGPSGCGKTTLLRMLAGFDTPDEGRILIDGADMAAVPPYERPVNMMFQSYALFPHMTVEGNVAYGLKQERLPRAEIRDRVGAVLDLVEMGQFAGRKPHQLSGGQRQRVALARALVKQPKLLLLDEPLAALDRKLRERTQFELVRIQERVGITFVVVTHDQEEAMTMASRLAVMEKGRVRQLGTPAEVYETPSSRFVADFIGSVNLFVGRVAAAQPGGGGGGGLVEVAVPDLGGARIAVAGDNADSVAPGAEVAVAVRPEKIALAPAGGVAAAGQGALNRLAGTVSEIGYLGQISIVHVELPNGTVLRASVANAHRVSEPPFARGDAVVLSFAPESAVLLTE